ncbi:MAG: RNA methyltransferase [Planctomycetes bacterium]|nr:RNA methyltransferase [Planctomycetota bacterium]
MSFPGNVRIVLVAPEHPGNVGSAARALFTMGLSQLWVVTPACDPQAEEAYVLAHNAADVVRNLRICGSLAEALADTHFSVGTTRRDRRVGYPTLFPEEAAAEIRTRSDSAPMAIVFGRESSGLTNPELALCSIQSTIPAASDNHSLNLAQAVQVYCYALHRAAIADQPAPSHWKLATHVELERFYQHLADSLWKLRLKPATTMDSYVARFRRVLSRIPLEPRDLNLLHKLLSKIDELADRSHASGVTADSTPPHDNHPAK